ncbi:MAG: SPOR domain-containing protein [Nitrosomonadales bacterium]|nr:SPOR domain-containing protein [Nitrosomonadales bacterium]
MAKQISTEEEFNIKRQSRRRLIGAVALILLVVIFLPIVFDSEPAPTAGNNIELRIPDKDKAPEFQPKIDLPQIDKMASEVEAAPTAEAVPIAASAPAAVLSPAPVVKPAVTAPAVSKPKAEVKPKPEVKPRLESKPAAKPQAAVPKTGWGVQVGAFANTDTARSLQAKLSQQGYYAYTEKAGNVTRVRIGSYPTREAAEKVQGKLAAQGTQANVVSLE